MEVFSRTLNEVFSRGGDVQYKLPHFQRAYAWEKSNWKTLFDDVMSVYEANVTTTPEHFLGAIVVIEDGTHNVAMTTYKLVDGQQRLVTISLLLCAIANRVSDAKLRRSVKKYLINSDEEKDLYFKIVPTEKYNDKEVYFSILNDQSIQNYKSPILDAYNFFLKQISTKIDLEQLFKCIMNYMQVVFIKLKREEQPYKIFESLNAKGKPLTQADLVRNYIAMRLPLDRQEQVFDEYWATIEDTLQDRRKTARIGELTAFLRHYLSHIAGALPNKDYVYARFRDRMETEYSSTDQFVAEIKNLHRFADYYNKLLRPENEPDEQIQEQLIRLNILETSTAYPFLVFLYDLYTKSRISHEEFIDTLKIVENYITRRFLANEPTNYLSKMFPVLRREVFERRISQSVKEALLNRNYPSDNRLRQRLLSNEIYDSRRQKRIIFVLETLNRHLSKDTGGHTVLDDEPTIEHIMPQSLSVEWRKHIGISWEEDHKNYLNIIGNLTIVTQEWNSSLSNSAFDVKRNKLSQHALLLNRKYFAQDIARWNADAICRRTGFLADLILEVWPTLGEQPEPNRVTGTKPVSLTILGQSFNVKTWREVVIQTAETVSDLAEDFESLASEFDKDFQRECLDNRYYRRMSNGWWLYINRSTEDVVRFCKKLVASVDGLSDKDWEVKYE